MSGGSHMFLPINSDRQRARPDPGRGDRLGQRRLRRAGRRHRRFGGSVRRADEHARAASSAYARRASATSTGLDDPEQRISSADLARLARHIIVTYPDFYRVYRPARASPTTTAPRRTAIRCSAPSRRGRREDRPHRRVRLRPGRLGRAERATPHHRLQRSAVDGARAHPKRCG